MAQLPDKSVQLIIADPPYFEVKGKFDFVWSSFDDYLKDVEKWAKEFKRVLADNGTLLYYGHAKKIAYSQIILDKYFNLENSLVWEKNECQNRRQDFKQSRCFAPVTERILMYSNESESNNLENKFYAENIKIFSPIIEYMVEQKKMIIKQKGYDTTQKFNDFVNHLTNTSSVVSRHYFTYSQWLFPTKEIYEKLQTTGFFQKPYEVLRQEYEVLRQEYEVLRRPFNNIYKLTDVLKFSQESHITKDYDHPTQKPMKLTRALIQTCSRQNDLVVIPFAGSGTELVALIEENRRFIGCEIDAEYYEIAKGRIEKALNEKQNGLF
jgi:site-specific DNA-methyltransferase (adenine-specific)